MSPLWRWFLPGYLWALPHTLVGLLLALIYRCHSWRISDGCIEAIAGMSGDKTRIWGRPWAQTHGWLIIYDTPARTMLPWLRAHERVHVVQAFIGGPLYALAYGFCFVAIFAAQGFQDWHLAYSSNPFETFARKRERLADRWGSTS